MLMVWDIPEQLIWLSWVKDHCKQSKPQYFPRIPLHPAYESLLKINNNSIKLLTCGSRGELSWWLYDSGTVRSVLCRGWKPRLAWAIVHSIKRQYTRAERVIPALDLARVGLVSVLTDQIINKWPNPLTRANKHIKATAQTPISH